MLVLNLQNVEELIFHDKEVRKLLPQYRGNFDQWTLGYTVPALRQLGKRALADFLMSLAPEDVEVLENHFGDLIEVDKLDYHIVQNFDATLEEAECCLAERGGIGNVSVYRDNDRLYISSWR
tara:strand:+ start:1114 stop:1479 length:366 start_codon:yes stop_codon:yes gene_type:complete